MISANLKADVKHQKIQELVTVSFIFYKSTFLKLEIKCNQACIFCLILLRILYPAQSWPLKTGWWGWWQGGRGEVLNGQNMSNMTKVIC